MEILLKLIYLPTTSMNIIEILKVPGEDMSSFETRWKGQDEQGQNLYNQKPKSNRLHLEDYSDSSFCHTLYRIQRTALNRNTKDLTLSTKSWRRSIKKLSSLKQEKIDYSEDYRKGLTNLKLSLQKKQEQVNFIEDLHVLQTKWQKSLRLKSIQWRSIKKTW